MAADVRAIEPHRLRASIARSPHRSPTFCVTFDISPLLDEHGRPRVEGDELEAVLVEWCRAGVRQALAKGRAQVPGHP